MRIDDFSFGKIKILGNIYSLDVIIFPDHVATNWWRKEGHNLNLDDLAEVLKFSPEILVIGTGAYGGMQVTQPVIRELERRGIKLHIAATPAACQTFNDLLGKGKLVGAFHLTC